jgi:hypothetical protein
MFDVFYLDNPINLPVAKKVKSLEEAKSLCRTRYLWIVDGLNDYSEFDFYWEPKPWEAEQTHVWPSQHQDNGGTLLIPQRDSTEVNRDHKVIRRTQTVPRLHIKHDPSSPDSGDSNTRFISDYMGTMRRALLKTNWEYCWVTTDVCNYDKFDFTWHPSEWQLDMLHVFASNEQKFGDTFYVHVPTFLEKTLGLKVLEWFETLHFVEDIVVQRNPPPIVHYETDTLVDAVWNHRFTSPVVQFYRNLHLSDPPTIPLWQEKLKTVMPLSKDNSTALVPREALNYLSEQIYDYPNIDKTNRYLIDHQQMDIVYISYDEPEAEKNWQYIKSRFPRTKRVHGVQGMENALKEAARVSDTPWYYAVFAKTILAESFEFDFVPDYMQKPKHYIFNCKNAVNGLEYGHMGIILYNCQLILDAPPYEELGLDYTISFPVEVVPELSCIGVFDTTPYHTWRTSFREAGKLAFFNSTDPNVENTNRLEVWQTVAEGEYAEWALNGARDGVEFFEESGGDLAYMKQSFDWNWLRKRFVKKYGDLV